MKRAFAEHTWKEIEALPKDPGVVVLPIGAIEQHGPHLPLLTDALLAEETVRAAFARLPEGVPAWYLPVLCYGKSNEHTGYPGTIALSAATLMAVVRDIAASVAGAGFKRLLLFNAHGGNLALLQVMARDLRAEFGLLSFVTQPDHSVARSSLPAPEQHFGIHAGTVETALMLHLRPDLVHLDRAEPHYPNFKSETLSLTVSPQVGWLTRDWSPEGHFGDPTVASAEQGKTWMDSAAQKLADLIAEVAFFNVAHPGGWS